MYLGGKLAARVQFTRAAGSKEKVRLKLLTSDPSRKKRCKRCQMLRSAWSTMSICMIASRGGADVWP